MLRMILTRLHGVKGILFRCMRHREWLINDRPQIGSEWIVEESAQGVFLFRSEKATKIVRGKVSAALLPLIDGTRSSPN